MSGGNFITCPLCGGASSSQCRELGRGRDAHAFECEACGIFAISGSAYADTFSHPSRLQPQQRRSIAVKVRKANDASNEPETVLVTSEWVNAAIQRPWSPPSYSQQKSTLLRLIFDAEFSAADSLCATGDVELRVGSVSTRQFQMLVTRLVDADLLKKSTGKKITRKSGGTLSTSEFTLTHDGMLEAESISKTRATKNYGFVAMQFGEDGLEKLLNDHLGPQLSNELGLELLDMRDLARAGVIDNLMRQSIEDAVFVLADLSHDNSGAYFEAGYAEGIGKPVIYICEKAKFDEVSTHFDTNHSTTVMWEAGQEVKFAASFIATLKRSLSD